MSRLLFLLIIVISIALRLNATDYQGNRAPLINKPYIELPLGSVKAEGWLLDQLQRMSKGMTGELDVLYPEVMSEKNGWLGGTGHAWERGPYWIDGLVPLAYTLNDQHLKDKAQKWIEWALASQQDNGFFGPHNGKVDTEDPSQANIKDATRDWWPRMVMLKVMQQYYSATGDQRIIDFLTRYFKYQLKELPLKPITYYGAYWAGARGGDNLMVVYWLYNITGDKYLLDLAELIHKQTFDWTNFLPDYRKMSTLFSLHTVNLAQGIKEPVIYYQQSGDKKFVDATEAGFENVMRFHGWPTGLYGGDEHLHTANPTQGSELCAAVEMMFSLEKILEITGDPKWADKLERIAFNALPTQTTDAFDARQYYQQCNQIEISRKVRNFQVNYSGTDQLFGLLTGYPCCTANLHQGWPKFTAHLWYATPDGGAAALAYSPCQVDINAGGKEINIKEDTFYPFDEKVKFTITVKDGGTATFPLHLRIPSWTKGVTLKINETGHSTPKSASVAIIKREWKNGDTVELTFPMTVTQSEWFENSVAIERGPLLYALKIGEDWHKVDATDRYASYYEVYPTSDWNYALIQSKLTPDSIDHEFVVNKKGYSESYPWNLENAPIEIKTKARKFSIWTYYNGNTGPLPFSVNHPHGEGKNPIYGKEIDITLIPYGCTTLRITEFPVVR